MYVDDNWKYILSLLFGGGLGALTSVVLSGFKAAIDAKHEDRRLEREEKDSVVVNFQKICDAYSARFDVLNDKIAKNEEEITELRKCVNDYEKRVEELEGIIRAQDMRIKELSETNELYLQRIRALEAQ